MTCRLTIGSDGPSNPFDGVAFTPYCSDGSPLLVDESSHMCRYTELGRAAVEFNNAPYPVSEYSYTILTAVVGPSYECRVAESGSIIKPGIGVSSSNPSFNRCGGRGEIKFRHTPTGETRTYIVEVTP